MTLLAEGLQAVFLTSVFLACCLGTGASLARILKLPGPFVLPLGFAALSLAGYAAFFVWYANREIGLEISLIAVIAGISWFAWQVFSRDSLLRKSSRPLWTTVILLVLVAGTYGLFLKAGDRPPATRFTHELPADDQLPLMFADRIAAGDSPSPLFNDWLSSDRPPLQAGIVLLFRGFTLGPRGDASAYQVIATVCQLMWLPALVALAHAVGLCRRAVATGLIAAIASGFFLVNTVYVWPKLCAAALLVSVIAIMIEAGRGRESRISFQISAALGVIAALATLAHAAVWFSLLALTVLPAAWHLLRRIQVSGVLVGLLCFGAISVPWTLYQNYSDPPGNRLLKWHLGGQVEVDDRGTWETVQSAYTSKPAAEHLERWAANLLMCIRFPRIEPDDSFASYVRRAQFFYLTPAVGLPALGALWLLATGWARSRGDRANRLATGLVGYSIATVVVWTALLFIPQSTVVHAGSYVPLVLLIFLGASQFGIWPRPIGVPLILLHAFVFVRAWIATTPVNPDGTSVPSNPWLLAAGFALMGACALCLLAFPLSADTDRQERINVHQA